MKIRVGVVGCGRMAQRFYIPTLKRLEIVELSAVCDSQGDILKGVCRNYSVESSYTDYSQLLGRKDIEAVFVLTPPETHHQIVSDALLAGKCVFVEKPLAQTLEQCIGLHELAQELRSKVMVGFMRRFDRALQWVVKCIKEQRLGDIFTVSTTLGLISSLYQSYLAKTDRNVVGTFRGSAPVKSNIKSFVLNQLIHHADLINWIVGTVESVYSVGSFSDMFNLQAIVKFRSELLGHMEFLGFLSTDWLESIVIHGSKGSITASMNFPYTDRPTQVKLMLSSGGVVESPLFAVNTMYEDQIESFFSYMKGNCENCSTTTDALNAQLLITAILRSLDLQSWVKVDSLLKRQGNK